MEQKIALQAQGSKKKNDEQKDDVLLQLQESLEDLKAGRIRRVL